MKKLNWDIVFERCTKKHDGRYKYYIEDQDEYISNKTKMWIVCDEHGLFDQTVMGHKDSGYGCPYCGGTMLLNWNTIFTRCTEKHNGRYTYHLEDQDKYKNAHMKMRIRCNTHGLFEQSVAGHCHIGNGCPHCANEKIGVMCRSDWDTIFEQCTEKHNGRYEYKHEDQDSYKNNKMKMWIHCEEHGMFEQTINNHKNNGRGCHTCAGTKQLNWDLIFQQCIKKHNGRYKYYLEDQDEYINTSMRMRIRCQEHGMFEQKVNNHKNNGDNCPDCVKSQGETTIILYLEERGINYISQHTYPDCRGDNRVLQFDFYLPDYHLLIEYDGVQHYKYVPYFHSDGHWQFEQQQRYDQIKNDYCKQKEIHLLRISYMENTLEALKKLLD